MTSNQYKRYMYERSLIENRKEVNFLSFDSELCDKYMEISKIIEARLEALSSDLDNGEGK